MPVQLISTVTFFFKLLGQTTVIQVLIVKMEEHVVVDLVHVLLGGKQITVRVGLEGRGKHMCANGDCECVPGS